MLTGTLRNIQYHPGSDDVAFLVELPAPMPNALIPGKQSAIAARTTPGAQWGDVEALAEAQALVDVRYPDWSITLVLPGSAAALTAGITSNRLAPTSPSLARAVSAQPLTLATATSLAPIPTEPVLAPGSAGWSARVWVWVAGVVRQGLRRARGVTA